jgi:hypothetical protein
MAAAVARIYAVVMRLSGVVAAVLIFIALACNAKNEAIVCQHENENVLAGCKATYDLCNGGQYVLDCKAVGSGGSGVRCDCIESGSKVKDFLSDDACNVSPDTLKTRAHDGCGWTID